MIWQIVAGIGALVTIIAAIFGSARTLKKDLRAELKEESERQDKLRRAELEHQEKLFKTELEQQEKLFKTELEQQVQLFKTELEPIKEQVNNHLPTEIRAVRDELKAVRDELKRDIKELRDLIIKYIAKE